MDSGSSGEKISSLSFPVVPGADPGLTPFLFWQQNAFLIGKKLSPVISQKQSGRHLAARVHHGFRDQLVFRKLPWQYHTAGHLYGQTASGLLTGQQMQHQRHISNLTINGIAKLLPAPFIIHRTHDHMPSADSIAQILTGEYDIRFFIVLRQARRDLR